MNILLSQLFIVYLSYFYLFCFIFFFLYIILFYFVLFCFILFYFILFDFILFYLILSDFILFSLLYLLFSYLKLDLFIICFFLLIAVQALIVVLSQCNTFQQSEISYILAHSFHISMCDTLFSVFHFQFVELDSRIITQHPPLPLLTHEPFLLPPSSSP